MATATSKEDPCEQTLSNEKNDGALSETFLDDFDFDLSDFSDFDSYERKSTAVQNDLSVVPDLQIITNDTLELRKKRKRTPKDDEDAAVGSVHSGNLFSSIFSYFLC
jgi:hypothetical protein